MKSKNQNNWATLLRDAVSTKDKIPHGDGWITSKTLAERERVSVCTIQRKIKILFEDGKVERFWGREDGKNRAWYRQVKPKIQKQAKA